jgi:hypothetical protein
MKEQKYILRPITQITAHEESEHQQDIIFFTA